MTVVYAAGGLTLDWVRLRASERGPFIGGNAAYAAVGAHLAGARAEIIAVLGADFPESVLDELAAAGFGVARSRVTDGPSFRVLLDDSGPERQISYLPGSGTNAGLDPVPSQLPTDLRDSVLHICAIPPASQRAFVDSAPDQAIVTLDTVHIPGQIEPTPEELVDLARRVGTFLPSREEAARFWPGSPEAAVRAMAEAGVRRAVVKMGPDGSMGLDDGRFVVVPAARAAVVDTTGAGDTYCGAYGAARGAGLPMGLAMMWGAAAASVVIEDYGLIHALSRGAPERAQDRFRELSKRTEVHA